MIFGPFFFATAGATRRFNAVSTRRAFIIIRVIVLGARYWPLYPNPYRSGHHIKNKTIIRIILLKRGAFLKPGAPFRQKKKTAALRSCTFPSLKSEIYLMRKSPSSLQCYRFWPWAIAGRGECPRRTGRNALGLRDPPGNYGLSCSVSISKNCKTDHGSCTRKLPLASYRSVSWTRFRNPSLSPLSYVQKNAALDVFVSRPMCVSLRFLWDANWAPRPLEYMALPV